LRNQYQLSRGTPHSQGRVSWDRRTNPAARILYYHRVNDDADPFFPAITTTLFEQQMSFLARHYKVVGMAELLDHLQNGSPEPVLAITFDDGYQDNYANALPILERYGLPATIFLSTGAIDSREPLWFEQLALALKKTDRAYLDIEVDIPRRFPLRTQQERLKANDAIFALLRALPNVDRTRYLDELLRQSGVVDDPERRNRMLTWEQIRLMTTRGITFGGHTVSHPFISKLPADQVTWEVSECKRRIEDQLQRPADYFAYPNGREQDFGAWNKDLIRAAGYKAAVTTIWGMNYRSTDPMELRRGGPWEQTAAQFAYKLDWYQLVND
jgi:peptidoglycan/xylan/chitin deacetylase (PgdA/CDA1 family)